MADTSDLRGSTPTLKTVRSSDDGVMVDVRDRTVIDLRDRPTQAWPLDGRLSVLTSALTKRQLLAKRVIDVVIGGAAATVLAPIVAVAALAIKVDTRGPMFFRQERIGHNGEPFTMYKLRSMQVNIDDSEHRAYVSALIKGAAASRRGTFKLVGDCRVTRVGRVIRRLSIDEAPQLWNVLRGDMSMVGPRPPLRHEVEQYDARAIQRLRVPPGLTGLWQVKGRCNLTFRQMVDLDLEYVASWKPRRDLLIMLKTPWVMLTGRGAA